MVTTVAALVGQHDEHHECCAAIVNELSKSTFCWPLTTLHRSAALIPKWTAVLQPGMASVCSLKFEYSVSHWRRRCPTLVVQRHVRAHAEALSDGREDFGLNGDEREWMEHPEPAMIDPLYEMWLQGTYWVNQV